MLLLLLLLLLPPGALAPAITNHELLRSLLVDALSRPLDGLQDRIEPVRLDHELLEALHRDGGQLLVRVAVEELRQAVGTSQSSAGLEEAIVGNGAAFG